MASRYSTQNVLRSLGFSQNLQQVDFFFNSNTRLKFVCGVKASEVTKKELCERLGIGWVFAESFSSPSDLWGQVLKYWAEEDWKGRKEKKKLEEEKAKDIRWGGSVISELTIN